MRALVTGGTGSLGAAIVRALLARGDAVRTLSRGGAPELVALGVDARRGDVGDPEAVGAAVAGCDAVFHTAARVGAGGSRRDFERANVRGTENVLAACRAAGVRRLVYTSTPSVVSAGGGFEGVDESAPYAERFESEYARSKAMAERLVLAANGAELATVVLRPHLVWGPGDRQLVPRIIARARAGRLRLVGDGRALVDTLYVDNGAEAHLLAADRLAAPGAACAGRAYFVTQGEPVPVGWMIDRILEAAGLPPLTRRVSPRVAYGVGLALELVYAGLRLEREPPMTRFIAKQLSTPHWFDISAARRDLGYAPRVSTAEGLVHLREALSGSVRGGERSGPVDAAAAPRAAIEVGTIDHGAIEHGTIDKRSSLT